MFTQLLNLILNELTAYSAIELAAVLLAIAYLLLAARNSRWCWVAAFISSGLFVYVLWHAKLYMDAGLNSYYVVMAVYGWIIWSKRSEVSDSAGATISSLPLKVHAFAIACLLALSGTSGFLLAQYTEAAFPYLDSITTWGSLFATWLLAQRKLENWIYWIVLDALGVYLYFQKGLHFTMLLFVLYVIVSVYALTHWHRLSQHGQHV